MAYPFSNLIKSIAQKKAFLGRAYLFLPIILSPIYLIKLTIAPGATINLLDILTTIIIFIYFTFNQKNLFLTFLRKNRTYILLLTGLHLGLVLSIFFNLDRLNLIDALGQLKSYFFLPALYSLILASSHQRKTIENYLLWTMFLLGSFIGFSSYLFVIIGRLSYDHRLLFIYESPNYLALIFLIGFFSGLAFIKDSSRKKILLIILLGLCAQLFGLIQTKSLSAIIALITTACFAFIYRQKISSLKKIPLKIALFSLIFLLIGFFPLISTLYQRDFTKTPSSFDSRIAIYSSSKKIISDNIFKGIGLSNFQNIYLEYQKYFNPYPQWAVPHPHNLTFYFWLSGGLLSLVSFLALLKLKTPCINRWLLIIFIAILIQNIFDTTIIKNDHCIFFFAIFSLLKTKAESDKVP